MLARRERVADIKASRQWLLQQPWAARDRISLMGWANGASAVLWAVRPQLSSRSIEPDFRSAIAFYPDCRISSGLGWSTRVPTLLLIGAQGRRQFAVRLPPDGRGRARPQRAGADRGLSRRARTISTAPICRCTRSPAVRRRVAGTRPYRHRCRSARGFAKARRGVAGAVSLKQTALIDRLGRRASARQASVSRVARPSARLAAAGRRGRPIRIRGGADAAVGEFDRQMRARSDRGGGMHGVALLVAHQRKAAREHAAIGQRRQQLAAMGDARLEPLHRGRRARGARARPAAACARGRARSHCAAPARWRASRPSA